MELILPKVESSENINERGTFNVGISNEDATGVLSTFWNSSLKSDQLFTTHLNILGHQHRLRHMIVVVGFYATFKHLRSSASLPT